MEAPTIKVCKKCGESKPATGDYFFRNSRTKDNLNFYCKECLKQYAKQWYNHNRDLVLKRQSEYEKEHALEIKERNRARYLKNKDSISERAKIWRKNNTEKIKERNKRYNDKNRDKLSETRKRYRDQNRDMLISRSKKHHKEYKENLKDPYIKSLLRRQQINETDISPEMIELKRNQLLVRRKINQLINESKTINSRCEVCGNEFKERPRSKTQTCSPSCHGKLSAITKCANIGTTPRSMRWFTCENCGKEYQKKPWRTGNEGERFCSRECYFELKKRVRNLKLKSRKVEIDGPS